MKISLVDLKKKLRQTKNAAKFNKLRSEAEKTGKRIVFVAGKLTLRTRNYLI